MRSSATARNARPPKISSPERTRGAATILSPAATSKPPAAAEMPRTWWGVTGPRATPEAVIRRVHADFRAVLSEPEAKKRIEALGIAIVANTPEEFARGLPAEAKRWETLVRALNLTAD